MGDNTINIGDVGRDVNIDSQVNNDSAYDATEAFQELRAALLVTSAYDEQKIKSLQELSRSEEFGAKQQTVLDTAMQHFATFGIPIAKVALACVLKGPIAGVESAVTEIEKYSTILETQS